MTLQAAAQMPSQLPETATPVVEHHLAGDLHLGRTSSRPPLPSSLESRQTGVVDIKSGVRPSGVDLGPPRKTITKERRASGMTTARSAFHWGFHRDRDKEGDDKEKPPSVANSDMQVRPSCIACSPALLVPCGRPVC